MALRGRRDGGDDVTRRNAIIAAVASLALVAHTARAWHRLEASLLVRAVQQQMAVFGGSRVPGPLLRLSEAALLRAHRADPGAVEPLAFRADLLLVAGRLADADAAYRRAAVHEARPEVLFNWGQALWRGGRRGAGAVQMRRGVALSPMRLAGQVPAEARALVEAMPLVPIPPLDAPDAPATAGERARARPPS
jgi:hypothetical protein